jgi:hypothetical protein
MTTARAVAVVARALVFGQAELDRARSMVEEQVAVLEGMEGGERILLQLYRVLINTLLRTESDIREAAESHARLADRVGDESDVADSYVSLALHFLTAGPRGLARVLLQSAADRARAAHDHLLLVRALTNLNADWAPDDARVAAGFGVEALEVVGLTGDLRWTSGATLNLVLARYLMGDWDDCLAALAEQNLDPLDSVLASVVVSGIALARGEEVPPVPELAAGSDDLALLSFFDALRACEAMTLGLPVRELVRSSAAQCFRQGGLFDDFAMLWQFLTELAWQAGDREAIRELFEIVAQDRVNRQPTGFRAQGALMRARLGIADGDGDESIEQEFRTAMLEANAWNSEPTLARARAELGAWLTRQGRAEEAEPLLAQARATYERLRATAWLAELDEQLAGVRP